MASAPRLLGLDWGSTGLRAFLLGDDGRLLATRAAKQGSSAMDGAPSAYCAALEDIAGDWLRRWPALPVLACGMVGSQHGWREVPYAACPADEQAFVAGRASVRAANDRPVWIVPGLRCDPEGAPPDVMRGEETQIIGALALRPLWRQASCLVLPGTHSKWAHIEAGRVQAFATHMTGELFAVLRAHSVLGRLMPAEDGRDSAAFASGVDAARASGERGLGHQLFSVRTLGLAGTIPASGLADYLSGLLIGHELRAALAWRTGAGLAEAPLALIGEPALCARYEQALRQFGVSASVLDNTAPAGLWRAALAGGMVQAPATQCEGPA